MDPPEVSERFRNELGAEFTFVSDESGELLDKLNIRHCCGFKGKDIAFPTGILVDKHGLVRWIYEAEFGHMRMTPQDLLDAMERLTLEEQNRELRRGRSVNKVVRQVFLMKKPDDLALAIDVMQKELRELGLRFAVCGIAIIDETAGKLDIYSALEHGGLETRALSVGDVPKLKHIIEGWKEHRVSTLRFDDDRRPRDDERPEWRWVVAVPFSHGVVFLGGSDTNEPSEDDVATLKEFADAITVAYQRFADFRDLQEAQLQLIQSEKMASLGQLVAGVAHELNTPMGALKSNTQTERATLGKIRELIDRGDHESLTKAIAVLEDMNGINEAAALRMSHIVSNLRRFARLDESEWKSSDVHEGLDETLALLEHQTKDRIEIEKAYGDLPLVHCYAGQLNQVFMNLIVNAIQAIEGNGRLRIETRRDGDDVVVRIADNGSGIAKADLDRVFDPGFTTKGVGVGTGLGLSICYRIIENHGGRLTVESEEGKGSAFTVAIPLNARRPNESARARSAYSRPLAAQNPR